MANSMWIRCPECGTWYFVEKKGFLGRLHRSFKTGDKELSETFGKAGDLIGMKVLSKTLLKQIRSTMQMTQSRKWT